MKPHLFWVRKREGRGAKNLDCGGLNVRGNISEERSDRPSTTCRHSDGKVSRKSNGVDGLRDKYMYCSTF